MLADLTIRQGTTIPSYSYTITDQDGYPYDLSTASGVKFVMRQLSTASPTVNAAVTIVNATTGLVRYDWTATDTATPGMYMGEFAVTFNDGSTYTAPNVGYVSVEVTPSLALASQQLITVEDAKDVLNFPTDTDIHDTKILRWIDACRPVIESYTGPIIQQTFEEWHDGGHYRITLRRRPSTAYGTSPVLIVNAISEYNGPIEWPLAIVSTLDEAVLYSVIVEKERGWITRTTAGGAVQSFPNMPQSVHVWYTAGQSSVPDNVAQATRELLRVNFQQTQERFAPGAGATTGYQDDDNLVPKPPTGFFVPGRVRELLAVNRRAPACA